MKINFSTFKSDRHEHERLYTVYLTPKDTLNILDAPAGWFTTEPITRLQLHILQFPFPMPKEKIFFEYSDECYTFVSQTGFKTDEDHLDWLVSHGKIPMVEATYILGELKIITLGYVEFKKAVA